MKKTQYVMKKSRNLLAVLRIEATEDRHVRRETLCLV